MSAYTPVYTSATTAPALPVRSGSQSPTAPDLTPVSAESTAEKPVVVYYNN